jgi:hypothetical protein
MSKNVFFINEKNNLNLNNLESFDSNKIGLVLSSNQLILIKHWIKFQQEWVNNIYNRFKDHEKYLILMYLISKTWQNTSNLFKFYSIDEYYSQNEIDLPNISLSEISINLDIPKETIRRKLIELEKKKYYQKRWAKNYFSSTSIELTKTQNFN